MNESTPVGIVDSSLPNESSSLPAIGQTTTNPIPAMIDNIIATRGTILVPWKNPSAVGNLVWWNLLYEYAATPPITIPPNTDVCIDVIPIFRPTTDDGTAK